VPSMIPDIVNKDTAIINIIGEGKSELHMQMLRFCLLQLLDQEMLAGILHHVYVQECLFLKINSRWIVKNT
jgi:hypothetical protein